MQLNAFSCLEEINEIDLYYEIHGKGNPLVLLHGFTGSSADWHPLINEWKQHFQLIIPDMRGHGRSTNSSKSYTFRQVALDIYALLDKLNIDKFQAIGCSGGASALLHMSTQQPKRMTSAILVSATSHYPEQARSIMRQTSFESLPKEQLEGLQVKHLHGDSQIRQLFEHAKAFADDYDDMNFTSAVLSTISAKTLLVQGDRDFLYPIDISINMYKSIPNASLWIIPDAGHVPIFKDLDYFSKTAMQFLKNNKLN